MEAPRHLSFLCVYSSVRVLREEEGLEPMVMKLLLAAATSTVSRYMTALQTIPTIVSSGDNTDEESAELTVLSTSIDASELLYDHTLLHKANIIFSFDPSILHPINHLDPSSNTNHSNTTSSTNNNKTCLPITLPALCRGPPFATIRMFANLSQKECDIRNTVIRYVCICICYIILLYYTQYIMLYIIPSTYYTCYLYI